MLCRICGTPIKAGEKFCSLCGEKAKVAEEIPLSEHPYSQLLESQQSYGGQTYRQQPGNQQPYGGQEYRREASRQAYRQQQSGRQAYRGQQPGGQPYGQYFDQPFGRQSSGNYYYSTPVKSKKWLWVTLGFIAAAAISAALIFAMPGSKPAADPQRPWPFKGDTVQTKFVNDTFKTYSDSFGILESGIDFAKLLEQPFEIKVNMTINTKGRSVNGSVDIAYDNETLGFNLNTMGASIKIMLLEDKMYMDMLGQVTAINLNSSADLSEPMPLSDRLIAIAIGGNYPYNALMGNDYITLTELFMNSIDEKYFESRDGKTTLTLHAEDIADTLRTFAKKLEENEELKSKLGYFSTYLSETPADVITQINDAADSLDKQKDMDEFEIVWEVSYKNEKPVAFEIKAHDGAKEYATSYSYEQNGESTDINLKIIPGNTSDAIYEIYSYKKRGKGVDIVATTVANGQTQTLSGYVEFDDNRIYGTENINIPYFGEGIFDFNITINIGMPGIKVKDDGRFKIDTSNAIIYDAS